MQKVCVIKWYSPRGDQTTKSNEFVIGGDFYEVVKKLQKYKFIQVKEYDAGFKLGYPVYKIQSK